MGDSFQNPNRKYGRQAQKLTLAAGARAVLTLNADWFFIHKLQANTEAGADVEIQLAVNGRGFAPVKRGEPGGGIARGAAEIETLEFSNDSASPVFIRVIYGLGERPYSPEILITNPTLTLDAATIAAIAAAINTGVTLKCKIVEVVNGAPQVFSASKSLEVIASGGNVTVTSPSGLSWVIPAGTGKDFSCEDDVNQLEAITVTCAVGATAEVSQVYI